MTVKKKKIKDLNIISDNLCLNFLNTVDWRSSKHPVEYLETPGDLILWCSHVGLLEKKRADKLIEVVNRKKQKSSLFLKEAHRLREALYRIFTSFITEQPIKNRYLALFNTRLADALKHACVLQADDGFILSVPGPEIGFEYLLYPVIQAAADLLTSEKLHRVKMCADQLCGWFFFDVSKNSSRRWCSMKDCGNRAKARRFYNKKRMKT